MEGKAKRTHPQIVIKNGKPTAVIIDIDEYRQMLERLEDLEDLQTLEEMRQSPLRFRKLEEFLEEYETGV